MIGVGAAGAAGASLGGALGGGIATSGARGASDEQPIERSSERAIEDSRRSMGLLYGRGSISISRRADASATSRDQGAGSPMPEREALPIWWFMISATACVRVVLMPSAVSDGTSSA